MRDECFDWATYKAATSPTSTTASSAPFPWKETAECQASSGEAWTDIARAMNWTLRFVKAQDYGGCPFVALWVTDTTITQFPGGYDPEKDGYFSGVLGMIQNGSVDGSIAFASLRPSRDQYFTFTEATANLRKRTDYLPNRSRQDRKFCFTCFTGR